MSDRIAYWDERYRSGAQPSEPSAPLPEAVADVQPGLALDLAGGSGRHTLWLAERGWRVHAIDGSQVALSLLQDDASQRGLLGRIETQCADIEADSFTLPHASFDLACIFYFLHRPLFAQVRDAVRPGGLFVAAIHFDDGTGGQYRLRPGELRDLAEDWGWPILLSREVPGDARHSRPVAQLVARKP